MPRNIRIWKLLDTTLQVQCLNKHLRHHRKKLRSSQSDEAFLEKSETILQTHGKNATLSLIVIFHKGKWNVKCEMKLPQSVLDTQLFVKLFVVLVILAFSFSRSFSNLFNPEGNRANSSSFQTSETTYDVWGSRRHLGIRPVQLLQVIPLSLQ